MVLLTGERLVQKMEEVMTRNTTDEENAIATQQATISPERTTIVPETAIIDTGNVTVAAENTGGSSQSTRAPLMVSCI